ncbi:hypothetical protein F2Q69_00023100 [Brassica cretica]|uniref:Uncharacterized protein n=1 Tax=Brassica cretica TaxID=69181 RepID=A0A8S9QAB4_BRACR|nr:hypothetical protein F2Q69_00023100 [Brassica cretica]
MGLCTLSSFSRVMGYHEIIRCSFHLPKPFHYKTATIGSMANKTSKSMVTEPSIVFFHDFSSGLGEAKLIFKLILLWEALRIDVEMFINEQGQEVLIMASISLSDQGPKTEAGGGGESSETVAASDQTLLYRGFKKAKKERGSIYRGVTRDVVSSGIVDYSDNYHVSLRQELNVLSYIAVGDAEEHMMMKRLLLELTTFVTFKYWGPGTLINFPVSMCFSLVLPDAFRTFKQEMVVATHGMCSYLWKLTSTRKLYLNDMKISSMDQAKVINEFQKLYAQLDMTQNKNYIHF